MYDLIVVGANNNIIPVNVTSTPLFQIRQTPNAFFEKEIDGAAGGVKVKSVNSSPFSFEGIDICDISFDRTVKKAERIDYKDAFYITIFGKQVSSCP